MVTIDTKACQYLIERVCKSDDKGVRTIKKSISDIMNKISFLVNHQDAAGNLPFSTTFKITKKLSYPLKISIKIIEQLMESKDLHGMSHMMYV